MGVVRLDFYDDHEESFDLIGLHTTVPFYRLAFFINTYLGVTFEREERDQDVSISGTIVNYPVFKHVDSVHNLKLYLVPNKNWVQSNNVRATGGLFDTAEPEMIKTVLIKEHVSVDYFLKIEQEASILPVDKMVSALSKIPAIISAYQLETLHIKQKDYLIFE